MTHPDLEHLDHYHGIRNDPRSVVRHYTGREAAAARVLLTVPGFRDALERVGQVIDARAQRNSKGGGGLDSLTIAAGPFGIGSLSSGEQTLLAVLAGLNGSTLTTTLNGIGCLDDTARRAVVEALALLLGVERAGVTA